MLLLSCLEGFTYTTLIKIFSINKMFLKIKKGFLIQKFHRLALTFTSIFHVELVLCVVQNEGRRRDGFSFSVWGPPGPAPFVEDSILSH